MKGNFKNSHTNDLTCRFCPRVHRQTVENPDQNREFDEGNQSYHDETQEHLEVCEGTENERRGLDMSNWKEVLAQNVDKIIKYAS